MKLEEALLPYARKLLVESETAFIPLGKLPTQVAVEGVQRGLLKEITSGSLGFEFTEAGANFAIGLVPEYQPLNVPDLIEYVLDTILFQPSDALDGETAIPWIYVPGTSRLTVVLGENASGKSLFRRVVYTVARTEEAYKVREVIHLSMEGRTGSANGNPFQLLVYGDERESSTGENSARCLRTGIKTVRGRDHRTILYWDEPDIGMSGRVAAGAGITIRTALEEPKAFPLLQAVFVTSHSVPLIRALRPLNPHYVFLGDANGPRTLDDWEASQLDPTPVTPDEIETRARDRYRRIEKVLRASKKEGR